jgi:hypothetical protein
MIHASCFVLLAGNCLADGKYSFYAVRMSPYYNYSGSFSSPIWGGGFTVVAPFTPAHEFLAVNIGIEFFDFFEEVIDYHDPLNYVWGNIETNQEYYRFYMGARFGGHGNGIFRPFVGSNFSLVIYYMHTDFVTSVYLEGRPMEVREVLISQTETVLGCDLNLGADIKLTESFIIESGMRYIQSFNVPVQLEDPRAITVPSGYLQLYISIGATFYTQQD